MTSSAIIDQPLSDPAVIAFLLRMLTQYWERCGLPAHQLPGIFTLLQRNIHDSEQAAAAVAHYYPEITQPDSRFGEYYRQARAGKFEYYADYLLEHVRPGVLVDIGAGDTQLADCLVGRNPAITQAYATDIFPCDTPPAHTNVTFVIQQNTTATPFQASSVDTVTISTMLHHMQPRERRLLLKHVFSVLKPGGSFVLIEDSFPDALPTDRSDLERRYGKLTPGQRMQCLCFLDWWGNRLMKNRPEIPLPCTFKTIKEWQHYLSSIGFAASRADFYGFPELPTHMMSPKVIIVAQKPVPADGL